MEDAEILSVLTDQDFYDDLYFSEMINMDKFEKIVAVLNFLSLEWSSVEYVRKDIVGAIFKLYSFIRNKKEEYQESDKILYKKLENICIQIDEIINENLFPDDLLELIDN